MLGIEKLEKAKLVLHQQISELIETIIFEPKLARIHVILRDKVEIFNSKLEILKGCGHAFTIEMPEKVNELLWNFIKEN